jgi:Ca-activated chloride channel family protein
MVKEISNIQFLWPYAFILIPLPFLIARYTSKLQWSTPSIRFPMISRVISSKDKLSLTQKSDKRNLKPTYIAMWILIVLATARPVLVDKNVSINQDGYDIVLAVDLSGSMQALDYSTKTKSINRLDAVKEVIANHFVNQRQGDRIGLVVFAEEAFLYSPLTFNYSAIEQMLFSMRIGMAGESTAIGDAIALSAKALEGSTSKNKIIILLTDGVDNASSIQPIEAAEIAKKLDSRVYTIGIGKDGLVPIPMNSGQIIMGQMPLDERTLNSIANLTFGLYARAETLNELEKIYDNINKLEKSEKINETFYTYKSLHQWPMGLFLVLVILINISRAYVRTPKSSLSKS